MITISDNNPRCGCCAKPIAKVIDLSSGVGRTVENVHGVRLVLGSAGDPGAIYRCEKHVGRNPCSIEGCGRTFPHSTGEGYQTEVICARHWRTAPKRMRDALSRVSRLGNRIGWSPTIANRYERLWRRCICAVRAAGTLDQAAIDRMFGWDVAA